MLVLGDGPFEGRGPPAFPPAAAAAAAILLFAFGTPGAAGAQPEPAPTHLLTLALIDPATGAPTAARLSVQGSDGGSLRPSADSLCLFQDALGGYFYADSAATLFVPAGPTRVRAAKGIEYTRFDDTLDVQSDTTVVIELAPWIEPRSGGWVGGEAHAHLAHPPVIYDLDADDALFLLRGEGVRVATFLEHGYLFTGEVDPHGDTDAFFFASEEYRSPIFGHLGLLGLDAFIDPDWGYLGWPLNREIIEEVRGHDHALAVYAHPVPTYDFFDVNDWPGTGLAREIWIDAALGDLDAMEVLSYSNTAVPGFVADTLWHHLWNSGFAVPGIAGTDACPGRGGSYPLGALRGYALVPDPYAPPGDLYDDWIEAVRRGRTFVTTGPVIAAFDVEGAGAGETLLVSNGMPLDVMVHARIEWSKKLRAIHVYRNGVIVETRRPTNVQVYEFTTAVPVRETSWITVRHDGWVADDFAPTARAFAEATPALVLLDGDALTSAASAALALERIDWLDSLLALVADYPSEAESVATAVGIEAARAVWAERADAPPGPFHLLEPCHGCSLGVPAHFAWGAAGDPDPGSEVAYRLVVASDPDFETILLDTTGIPGVEWAPSAPLGLEGVCWWRVRASDSEGARRWAEEIDRWFEAGIETAVPPARGPGSPWIAFAPNPTRGEIVIRTLSPRVRACDLFVYTPSGRLVASVVLPASEQSLTWSPHQASGAPISPGVYFYRIDSAESPRTGKLTIIP